MFGMFFQFEPLVFLTLLISLVNFRYIIFVDISAFISSIHFGKTRVKKTTFEPLNGGIHCQLKTRKTKNQKTDYDTKTNTGSH